MLRQTVYLLSFFFYRFRKKRLDEKEHSYTNVTYSSNAPSQYTNNGFMLDSVMWLSCSLIFYWLRGQSCQSSVPCYSLPCFYVMIYDVRGQYFPFTYHKTCTPVSADNSERSDIWALNLYLDIKVINSMGRPWYADVQKLLKS